jgi:hypothetical protein
VPIVISIKSGVLPDVKWTSRVGASCPRVSFPGMSVPAAGFGIGTPAVAAHAVPRVRGKVAPVAPSQTVATVAQLGQPNSDNYMTRVYADGEGASGPPTHREPA